jgi:lipopolysaccharide transport system ATP-binding protein
MSETVIKVEGLSKNYRLGEIGTGTLSHDLNRLWYKSLGRADPYSMVDQSHPLRSGKHIFALNDLSFEVKEGDILGVIGRNGAGKSTLLKILSRITAPTQGSVKIRGRIAALLEVGTGFHADLTGRENIFLNGAILGMTKKEIQLKLDEIIEFSGIGQFLDTPVKRYSTGMVLRLGFAIGAFLEPEILIVDEVLAVGDAEFQKKCLGKMKDVSKVGRTVLFVSHNMSAVRSLCRSAILLENGKLSKSGKADEVVKHYLALNSVIATTGVIPSEYHSGYGSGEAKFKKLTLTSDDNIVVSELHFGQELKVGIELGVNKPVKNCTLGIIIGNEEVHRLIFIKDNGYSFHSSHNFEPGTHEIGVNVNCRLMPGKYFLSAILFETKGGYTIDFVENVFSFSITHTGWERNMDLPEYISHGQVEAESKWKYHLIASDVNPKTGRSQGSPEN